MSYRLEKTGFLMNIKGCGGLTIKRLNIFDWLCDLPEAQSATDFVEVQFKNTRKAYYLNSNKIPLKKGDIVAVEAMPGYDIGTVTLTGQLVMKQMKKNNYRYDQEVRRVYRKARPVDMDKYYESKAKEHDTMLKSRKIAEDLQLNMKIGDVEYQGDGNKAIFYYIADGRVDFRQLIKVLADAFKVRIEMKQIGARQEAGRIGGIGPCGREMCCSAWMTNFVSVSTSAARYQDISLNPQKLAGQCAKLKCCMNYETDTYVEALKDFPHKDICLETKDATYYPVKNDILRHTITYSTSKDTFANLETIPLERALKIIALNKRGIKVDNLSEHVEEQSKNAFGDILNSDYTRFDKPKKEKRQGNNHPAKDKRKSENQEHEAQRDNKSKRASENMRGNQPSGKQEGEHSENNHRNHHRNANRQNNKNEGIPRNNNNNNNNTPNKEKEHHNKPQKPNPASENNQGSNHSGDKKHREGSKKKHRAKNPENRNENHPRE